jgi:hypothetical protein
MHFAGKEKNALLIFFFFLFLGKSLGRSESVLFFEVCTTDVPEPLPNLCTMNQQGAPSFAYDIPRIHQKRPAIRFDVGFALFDLIGTGYENKSGAFVFAIFPNNGATDAIGRAELVEKSFLIK